MSLSTAVPEASAPGGRGPDRSGSAAAAPGRTAQRWVLAATSLAAFVAFLDATIVNIAFPSLQASFPSVSRAGLSWVLNGYNIVFAALLVPAGRLADVFGRRRAFRAGIVAFGLASLACAVAPSSELLVAARLVQAAGAAVLVPTSLGLLLDAYPPEDRIQAIAIIGSAAALAAACGPVFGGLLVHAFGWRAVFVVNLPLCVLALLMLRFRVPRGEERREGRIPDPFGILLLAAGMALIALALTRPDGWGWGSGPLLGSLAGGLVLLAGFALRSRRHPSPAVELGLLRVPTVRMANAAIIVFAAAFYAKILVDVLFLTTIWQYSILTAGAALTPGPLVTAILAAPCARLALRYGATPVAAAGALVYAVACVWYATQAGHAAAYASVWLPGAALTGAGIALAFPSFTSAAVLALPDSRYATGSALNAAARQLGGVLGIAIVVSILGASNRAPSHAAFVHAWTYASVSAALAAVVAIVLGRGTLRASAPARA